MSTWDTPSIEVEQGYMSGQHGALPFTRQIGGAAATFDLNMHIAPFDTALDRSAYLFVERGSFVVTALPTNPAPMVVDVTGLDEPLGVLAPGESRAFSYTRYINSIYTIDETNPALLPLYFHLEDFVNGLGVTVESAEVSFTLSDAPWEPEPEVECFWTDLVGVSQVCGSAPEPEPELPVVFAYNQHQGTPEGQTSRILLPPGVVQFTPVWVNGLYEFQDAEGGGGMLQTVDYADAYGLVGPATLSNEQTPGEDWYEEVDVIIEYRSGVGYAQAGGWHGDSFMVVDSATTGAPEYDTLYPIDVNSDLGPVQLQIGDRVWSFEWESGRYVTQDPPPAVDTSGWGTITQNGVVAPMLITFFALWE